MKFSTIHRISFLIYAAALLIYPLKVVLDQEATLDDGTAYRFKCAPVDPRDIFRGKYVQLAFENNSIRRDPSEIDLTVPIYGKISLDAEGFAYVADVSNKIFENTTYLELKDVSTSDSMVRFSFPFDRFYMNEEKAPLAEQLYRDQLSKDNSIVFAKVYINGGKALLDDLYVNNQPIKDLIN